MVVELHESRLVTVIPSDKVAMTVDGIWNATPAHEWELTNVAYLLQIIVSDLRASGSEDVLLGIEFYDAGGSPIGSYELGLCAPAGQNSHVLEFWPLYVTNNQFRIVCLNAGNPTNSTDIYVTVLYQAVR